MKPENYRIRQQLKARLLRKYRGGLIKKKTRAEAAFEDILKKLGVDFISQAGFLSPRSFYIADFYIKSPYKLIVEIDGENHKQGKRIIYDKRRISYFRRCGFSVLRFSNDTILSQGLTVERRLRIFLGKLKNKFCNPGIPMFNKI